MKYSWLHKFSCGCQTLSTITCYPEGGIKEIWERMKTHCPDHETTESLNKDLGYPVFEGAVVELISSEQI